MNVKYDVFLSTVREKDGESGALPVAGPTVLGGIMVDPQTGLSVDAGGKLIPCAGEPVKSGMLLTRSNVSSWTPPHDGVYYIEAIGGGGGGGCGGKSPYGGCGGGAGERVYDYVFLTTDTSLKITVGTGGNQSGATSNPGGNGGDTTVYRLTSGSSAALITAEGGKGGDTLKSTTLLAQGGLGGGKYHAWDSGTIKLYQMRGIHIPGENGGLPYWYSASKTIGGAGGGQAAGGGGEGGSATSATTGAAGTAGGNGGVMIVPIEA